MSGIKKIGAFLSSIIKSLAFIITGLIIIWILSTAFHIMGIIDFSFSTILAFIFSYIYIIAPILIIFILLFAVNDVKNAVKKQQLSNERRQYMDGMEREMAERLKERNKQEVWEHYLAKQKNIDLDALPPEERERILFERERMRNAIFNS